MHITILVLNLLVALTSAAAGVIALVRPASLTGSPHLESGEIFYARMYAARSIPFGLVAAIFPFWRGGLIVAGVLFTAGVIQVLDVVIAANKKDWRMASGASFAALVHFFCVVVVSSA
jgi:hypothetical protein